METVKLEFEWTEEDFIEANWANLKAGVMTPRFALFMLVFFAVKEFILDADQAPSRPLWNNPVSMATIVVGGLVSLTILYFINRAVFRVLWKRAFAKNSMKGQPVCYEVSDKDLYIASRNIETRLKWGFFSSWKESENLILLRTGNVHYAVPKRCLHGDKEAVFRRILQEKIGAAGKTRAQPKAE